MRRTLPTLLLLAALTLPLSLAAAQAALPSDEDRLKQTGIQTDNRSLFALIRPRTPPEPAVIADLIRKLGGDHFKQREEAERALRAIGQPALAALDKAATDPDAEVARRAKDCRETIVQQVGPKAEQALLAVRLLLRRAPPDVVAALLEHLPAAPSTDVEEAIWFGIDALAATAKELDPALVAGLTDPQPAGAPWPLTSSAGWGQGARGTPALPQEAARQPQARGSLGHDCQVGHAAAAAWRSAHGAGRFITRDRDD